MSFCKNCSEPIPINHVQVGGVHMNCEHEYFHTKNVLMFSVQTEDRGTKCIVTMSDLVDLLENDLDEKYLVQAKKMSKGEIESLPEFTGF